MPRGQAAPPIVSQHNISIHLPKAWESTPPAGRLCLRLSWCSLRPPIPFSFIHLSLFYHLYFSPFLFFLPLSPCSFSLLSITVVLRVWPSAPREGDASADETNKKRAECGEIRLAFWRVDLVTPVFEKVNLEQLFRGFGFDIFFNARARAFFEDLVLANTCFKEMVLVIPVSRNRFWQYIFLFFFSLRGCNTYVKLATPISVM